MRGALPNANQRRKTMNNNNQMISLPLGGQPRAVNYNLVIVAKLQAAKPLPLGGQPRVVAKLQAAKPLPIGGQPRAVNYNLVISFGKIG
jgi:hypothetical protein